MTDLAGLLCDNRALTFNLRNHRGNLVDAGNETGEYSRLRCALIPSRDQWQLSAELPKGAGSEAGKQNFIRFFACSSLASSAASQQSHSQSATKSNKQNGPIQPKIHASEIFLRSS